MRAFIATLVLLTARASAQEMQNGCLRLLGSVACPGFSYAYLSPSNLTNAFPFFSTVTDVTSFDTGALNYFKNQYEFEQTKFQKELGCSNASNAVIRWERTVLCSQWVNEMWSSECLAFYNGTSAATTQKMVCQNTCLEYSSSEYSLVNNTDYCPGPDMTNGNRNTNLVKDFTDCTNWTSLATKDLTSCVSGMSNEGRCGFGTATTELCTFCSGSSPDPCCYQSDSGASVCGYVLPAQTTGSGTSTATSSSPSPSSSGSLQHDNSSSSSHLKGGKLAGTIVGAVIGGVLLLGLLGLLLFRCTRRRRRQQHHRDSASSFAAGDAGAGATGGVLGGFFASNRDSHGRNTSEKGFLQGSHYAAAASSPTMGGDTYYSGSGGKGSVESAAMLGTGAGVGGLAAGAAPGERTSGVVLPRVKDENQSGDRWIETGAEVSVLWPYQASLPDELDLRPGMKLRVLRLYDDAWGTAQVISGGEPGEIGKQGAFPIVCVSEGSSFGGSSARTSSTSH